MSLNLSKSPLWATIVIVGLIAATALVAGYVDRPGTDTEVAAADKCASCPREGTAECCKVTGVCAETKRNGGDGSACPDGGTCPGKAEKTCSSAQAGCSKEASGCGACPKASAEKTCSSAQSAGCPGGGCSAAK